MACPVRVPGVSPCPRRVPVSDTATALILPCLCFIACLNSETKVNQILNHDGKFTIDFAWNHWRYKCDKCCHLGIVLLDEATVLLDEAT
ncbi:hypothetical protein LOK49_LG09G01035, partial [Camellia lanceoleosa]